MVLLPLTRERSNARATLFTDSWRLSNDPINFPGARSFRYPSSLHLPHFVPFALDSPLLSSLGGPPRRSTQKVGVLKPSDRVH